MAWSEMPQEFNPERVIRDQFGVTISEGGGCVLPDSVKGPLLTPASLVAGWMDDFELSLAADSDCGWLFFELASAGEAICGVGDFEISNARYLRGVSPLAAPALSTAQTSRCD